MSPPSRWPQASFSVRQHKRDCSSPSSLGEGNRRRGWRGTSQSKFVTSNGCDCDRQFRFPTSTLLVHGVRLSLTEGARMASKLKVIEDVADIVPAPKSLDFDIAPTRKRNAGWTAERQRKFIDH